MAFLAESLPDVQYAGQSEQVEHFTNSDSLSSNARIGQGLFWAMRAGEYPDEPIVVERDLSKATPRILFCIGSGYGGNGPHPGRNTGVQRRS